MYTYLRMRQKGSKGEEKDLEEEGRSKTTTIQASKFSQWIGIVVGTASRRFARLYFHNYHFEQIKVHLNVDRMDHESRLLLQREFAERKRAVSVVFYNNCSVMFIIIHYFLCF